MSNIEWDIHVKKIFMKNHISFSPTIISENTLYIYTFIISSDNPDDKHAYVILESYIIVEFTLRHLEICYCT